MKRRFAITVSNDYIVTIDNSLTPDDEWRSVFYPFHNLSQLAEHVLYNRKIRGDTHVEGILPEDHDKFDIQEPGHGWEFDTVEKPIPTH